MSLMLFVDVCALYVPFLDHAYWNGLKLPDFVMPSFLFVTGVTVGISRSKPQRSFSRSIRLFLIGVLVQGRWIPQVGESVLGLDIKKFRVMGILQRIAVVYLILALTVTHLTPRTQFVVPAVCLLIHFLILLLNPSSACTPNEWLSPGCDGLGRLDIALLGPSHILSPNIPNEPEGLGSSLACVFTAFVGYLVGVTMRADRASSGGYMLIQEGSDLRPKRRVMLLGLLLASLGLFVNIWIPFNKKLWTPSYNFFTAGVCCLILVLCTRISKTTFMTPFTWLGANGLLFFILSDCGGVVPALMGSIWAGEPTNNMVTNSKVVCTWICQGDKAVGMLLYTLIEWLLLVWFCRFLFKNKLFFRV